MTALALALLAALLVEGTLFVGALDRQRRAHARREDLLLNQLLHATGHTWQPPPVAAREESLELPPREFFTAPEQEPIEV